MVSHLPAQDLVLHIFTSSTMMATKWEMSPISLKMFITVGVLASPVQTVFLTKSFVQFKNPMEAVHVAWFSKG